MKNLLAKYKNRQGDSIEILDAGESIIKKNITTGKEIIYLGSHNSKGKKAREIIAKDMPVSFEYTDKFLAGGEINHG